MACRKVTVGAMSRGGSYRSQTFTGRARRRLIVTADSLMTSRRFIP